MPPVGYDKPAPSLRPIGKYIPGNPAAAWPFLSLVVPMQAIITKGGNDEIQTVGTRSVFGFSFSSVGPG
jgi:hypothetical protein